MGLVGGAWQRRHRPSLPPICVCFSLGVSFLVFRESSDYATPIVQCMLFVTFLRIRVYTTLRSYSATRTLLRNTPNSQDSYEQLSLPNLGERYQCPYGVTHAVYVCIFAAIVCIGPAACVSWGLDNVISPVPCSTVH